MSDEKLRRYEHFIVFIFWEKRFWKWPKMTKPSPLRGGSKFKIVISSKVLLSVKVNHAIQHYDMFWTNLKRVKLEGPGWLVWNDPQVNMNQHHCFYAGSMWLCTVTHTYCWCKLHEFSCCFYISSMDTTAFKAKTDLKKSYLERTKFGERIAFGYKFSLAKNHPGYPVGEVSLLISSLSWNNDGKALRVLF